MFMCHTNSTLRKYLVNFMIVFIYDILVYSKTREENEEHVELVFQTLREHKIYGKYIKCKFYESKGPYL
jgi:hypothetical protein